MAGRLLTPGWSRALDSDGFPIAARISFFLTGTDELAAVYANENLSTPLTNPVPSNSAGRFPAIWAADDVSYDWSVEAPYGPPGTPFTGTGLTTALASEVLAADAAEAAADAAEASAVQAQTAETGADLVLAEILDVIADAPEAPSVVNKANIAGDNIAALGQQATFRANIGAVGSTALASSSGGDLVGNALSAGANLRTQTYSEFVEGGLLMPSEFSGTDEQRLVNALTEATTPRNGALGQTTILPRGVTVTTAPFNMNNRAMLKGVNKRGSIIRADPAHVGPSMLTVINGVGSTFDNRVEELTLDCNDVAGMSAVISSAWQEGGGIRDCLVQKFRQYGLNIVGTFGGVSQLLIENSEFFGSANGALSCIRFEDPSLVSGTVLMMSNLAVTGGVPVAAPGGPTEQAAARAGMPSAVNIVNGSSTSVGVHIEVAERGFLLDGNGKHVIIGAKGSAANGTANAGVETLVEIASTFTGELWMIGCRRNGATNLLKDNRSGGLGTITWDTDVTIRANPPLGLGEIVAGGNFNGNLATPNIDKSFGVTSIVKGTAGVYTINLTRPGINASSFTVVASTIAPGGSVSAQLVGSSSMTITNYNSAGAAADAIEIKFIVVRCA